MDKLRKLSPTQILVPLAVAIALFAGGLGVGLATSGDDAGDRFSPARFADHGGDRDFRGERGERGFRGRHGFRGPGGPGFHHGGPGIADPEVRAVVREVFMAIAARAPGIANPIIDKAVADKKITAEQARRLKARVARVGARGR